MVNFDDLTSTEFEELCFNLLDKLGYLNLDWRKGTGIENASPADKGRDIEGICRVQEPDGSFRDEKWFFEVKHHKKGVPPTELSGAIAWAQAENADCLQIICSGFLSNPSKDFIEQYRAQGMRINVWENKKLEKLLLPYPSLQVSFKLEVSSSVIEDANINHIDFALSFHMIDVEDFIDAMNELDPDIRDSIFGQVYHQVISPRILEDTREDQPLSECYDRPVDYESFRTLVLDSTDVYPPFQVQAWVIECLNYARNISSKSSLDRMKEHKQSVTEFAQKILDKSVTEDERRKAKSFLETNERLSGSEEEMKARLADNEKVYNYVCDQLLPKLVAVSGRHNFRDLPPDIEKRVQEIREIYDREEIPAV